MKVELTLVNTRTGYESTASTMVECLNLEKIRIINCGGRPVEADALKGWKYCAR